MRVLSTAISSVVTKTVHFFTIKKLDTLVILLAKIGYKKDIYKHRLLFCRLARMLIIRDESWNEIEIWRYPYFSNVWMLIPSAFRLAANFRSKVTTIDPLLVLPAAAIRASPKSGIGSGHHDRIVLKSTS